MGLCEPEHSWGQRRWKFNFDAGQQGIMLRLGTDTRGKLK